MDKHEIIKRLKNIAGYAVHTVGEEPFVMSLDDGIAVHEAIELLKKPETNCSEIPNNSDTISRTQAIDAMDSEIVSTNPEHFKSSEKFIKFMDDADIASFGKWQWANGFNTGVVAARIQLKKVPSAQPEIVRCKDCIYYDPPHVENNGVRYEYDEMPADAFDALGTGLVNAEYGINIGGRCCVDYYCKNYSDDKRVFVREDNYCGRAERRTDD